MLILRMLGVQLPDPRLLGFGCWRMGEQRFDFENRRADSSQLVTTDFDASSAVSRVGAADDAQANTGLHRDISRARASDDDGASACLWSVFNVDFCYCSAELFERGGGVFAATLGKRK